MTGSEVSSKFEKHRRCGAGKWRARCPAHRSKGLTLSIMEGKSWVLITCFAGCELKDILDCVGLKVQDLAYGALPDRKTMMEIEKQQKIREGWEMEFKQTRRKMIEKARSWETVVGAMGKLLAGHPEDEKIAALFNKSLEISRHCQMNLAHFYPEKTRLECEGYLQVYPYKSIDQITRKVVGQDVANRLNIR